jgi:hypothetical protein
MDELNFVRSAAGLYYAGAIPTPADGPTAAYLPVAGDPGIASVPLTVTWNDAAIRGPYLLLARAPADEPSFIDAVKSLLSTLDPDTRFLWIDEPDARPLVASSLAVRQAGGSGAGVVVETRSYPSNGFRLDLSAGMGVDVRLPDGFAITAGTAGGATLVDESDGKPFGVCGSTLVLALPAATACSIVVPLDVSAADLGARTGGDIRYFYRDANSALVELRYPLFAALQDTTLAFDARFDLRAAPGVGGLTELRFARGSLQARYPSQLLTTTGLRLALTPDSDAGFVRARVPGPDAPGYLTPHGTFTAMPDVRRNGRTTAAAAPAWLPGLVATECVPFPAGLRFTFTGPGAAYAPAFPPLADRDDAVLLSS